MSVFDELNLQYESIPIKDVSIVPPLGGVYLIKSPHGNLYCGQSIDLSFRLKSHLSYLTRLNKFANDFGHPDRCTLADEIFDEETWTIDYHLSDGDLKNIENLVHSTVLVKYSKVTWDKNPVSGSDHHWHGSLPWECTMTLKSFSTWVMFNEVVKVLLPHGKKLGRSTAKWYVTDSLKVDLSIWTIETISHYIWENQEWLDHVMEKHSEVDWPKLFVSLFESKTDLTFEEYMQSIKV